MTHTFTYVAISVFLFLVSCGYYYPSNRNPYGARTVLYGDGRHPGIDWDVVTATPIIAASDGEVALVYHSSQWGGHMIRVSHGEHFDSWYGHLAEVHVQSGQSLRRGQLIGLSGADYTGRQYLHFGICRKGGFVHLLPGHVRSGQVLVGGTASVF